MGWVKMNGKASLVDPQTGRIVEPSNDLLKTITKVAKPDCFWTSRLDNLELKPGIGTAMRDMIGTPGENTSANSFISGQRAALDIMEEKKK